MQSRETELTEYLKSMLEGTAMVRFRVWFKKNDALAKATVTPPEFSRLKFMPVRFAHEYLTKRNVSYTTNHSAVDMEEFLAEFPESCADEAGNLVFDKVALLHDGLLDAFLRGKLDVATEYVVRLWDVSKAQENGFLSDDLREFMAFAEAMARIHKDFSRFVCKVLTQQAQSTGMHFREIAQLGTKVDNAPPLP